MLSRKPRTAGGSSGSPGAPAWAGAACRRRGAAAGVRLDAEGQVFDGHNPDMGAHSTGIGVPEEPAIKSVSVSGKEIMVTVSGEEGAINLARLLTSKGAVDDEGSRSGDGEIALLSSEDGVSRTVVCWSEEGERARSKPVAPWPPKYYLSSGPTSEEIATELVSALEGSQGVTDLLASPDAIYLSHPPKGAALPCLVYKLTLRPRMPGFEGELELASWAKSGLEARKVIEEAGKVFLGHVFKTSSYDIRGFLTKEADADLDEGTGLRFERLVMTLHAS